MLALVGLGVGSIIGSLAIGKIQDRFGNVATATTSLVVTLLSWACLLALTFFYRFSMWAAVLVTFSWGLQNSCVHLLLNILCGFEFDDKTTPFSVYQALQAFFVFLLICAESLLVSKEEFLIYYACGVLLSVGSYLLVIFTFRFRSSKSDDQYLD